MPTTNRGYPYETAADEPGHSLTGGSGGSAPILAQVVDADVADIDARTTANTNGVNALGTRMTTAENNIGALDTRMTTAETNITANANDLAAHEADTTDVHGITDTANLVYTDDPRLTDARTPTAHNFTHASGGSDPVTPAAIGAYPVTGGEIEGDVSLTAHNWTIETTDGLNALRARSTGAAVDFDTVGDTTVISWSGAGFTGTETIRQRWHSGGMTVSGRMAVGTTVYGNDQYIDADAGVAVLGGKNGLEPVVIVGRSTTVGAPSTGTWDAGDLMIDSVGVWHLCTAGGTPGTWT
jgi:hypothetical protein